MKPLEYLLVVITVIGAVALSPFVLIGYLVMLASDWFEEQ